MYTEIRHNHIWGPSAESGNNFPVSGDVLAAVSIDGWKSGEDDKQGTAIANVILTRRGDIVVDFRDNGARLDEQVKEHIASAWKELKDIWIDMRNSRKHLCRGAEFHAAYQQTLYISAFESEQINKYLHAKSDDEYQGEDGTIIHTARFPDGKEMDIKCCGCRDDPSWTEAVLFDANGYELTCSGVCEEYEGLWELEYEGVVYAVNVLVNDVPDTPVSPSSIDKEGICLVCGASIEYEGKNDIDDDGGTFPWNCPKCGASGLEGYTRLFDRHYNVVDANGGLIPGREEKER